MPVVVPPASRPVATDEPALDRVFKALADPIRRSIIARLSQGPATVSELGAPFAITKPAVTKHLKVLEAAGLLQRTKDGRVHRCELDPGPMGTAMDWIAFYRRFWARQFAQLEAFLADTAPDPDAPPDATDSKPDSDMCDPGTGSASADPDGDPS